MSQLLQVNLSSFSDVLQLIGWACKQNQKYIVGQLRLSCILHGIWAIWNCRNPVIFEHKITTQQQSIAYVRRLVTQAAFMRSGITRNVISEIQLCTFFKAKIKFAGGFTVKEVRVYKPQPRWTKVNIDGSALGQPGKASCGGIFTMSRGFSKGCFAMPLATQTSMYAELMGFVIAIELAKEKNWFPLWVETDSTSLLHKVTSSQWMCLGGYG